MGGESSSNQATTQQTTPYTAAVQPLNGILGNIGGLSSDLTGAETGALDVLQRNASAGNPFAPGISNVANTLLAGGGPDRTGMVNDAYGKYIAATDPYASGKMSGLNSPEMQTLLDTIQNRVGGGINQMFAASGRDGSGMNQKTYASGVTEGLAQPLFQQMNTDTQNRLAAITGQFGAGTQAGGILSGLDQTKLGNMTAGIDAANAATTAQNFGPLQTLQIEAQRRGIPLQTMAQQMGIVLPAGQAFGTTTGNQQGTATQPWSQTFAQAAGGLGSLFGGAGQGAAGIAKLSDDRTKENKAEVGRLFDGTPVWSFNYIGDPTPQIGLMAQEVEQRQPDAVIEVGGIKFVNYDRATEKARAIGKAGAR